MLNIEELKAVRTIISHGPGCPDGIASALILHDVLPSAEIMFVQYKTPEHEALEAKPNMLFVDFSPPTDRVADFIHAKAIVLDHHRTAKPVVGAFGARGVFADEEAEPGVSGAVLAFREVWLPLYEGRDDAFSTPLTDFWKDFAELAGIRDTWVRSSLRWKEACAQAEALRFWPMDRLWVAEPPTLYEKLRIGPVLLERQAEAVDKIVDEAFRFTSGAGLRVAVFNSTSLTSDAAEKIGADADLVMGFHYLADKGTDARVVWSCRSRGDFDVAAFAKANGGGGHTRAAGFSVRLGADAVDPFTTSYRLVANFEASR